MISTVDFPSESHIIPFPFDFNLFPAERPSPSHGQTAPVAAISSVTIPRPQRSIAGPSSRPIQHESTSPVITFEDYQIDTDSDSDTSNPEPPPPPPTQTDKGKGKGREVDQPNADPSLSLAASQSVIPTPTSTPPSPPSPPAPPPSAPSVSTPPSPPSSSRRPVFHRQASRFPIRNRSSHQRVPSDVTGHSPSTTRRRRTPEQHPLHQIRRLIGQALAAVPRTIESL